MTEDGRALVDAAKKNGKWDAPPPPKITDEQVGLLTSMLVGREPAFMNFMNMSPLREEDLHGGLL